MRNLTCEHKAPIEYCPICSTEESRNNILSEILNCPNCIDGFISEPDMDGGWYETACHRCREGKLDAEQSRGLHRVRLMYWKNKVLTNKEEE